MTESNQIPVTDTTVTPVTNSTVTLVTDAASTEKPGTPKAPNNPGKGFWSEQKAKLKAEFPVLTDADLYYENGKKDDMFSRIQEKIGKTREELTAILASYAV